jgi:hypothetical protein
MPTSQTEDPRDGETDLGGGETAEHVHAQTARISVDDDEDGDGAVIRVFEECN